MSIIIVLVVLFLAYANGANDNFKGVATLFGSRTTTFNKALAWATFTTLLGSLSALILAESLLKTFSGKGLVPDAVLINPAFASSVGLGAAITVFLATRLGFPISTTHALTGALVGAGLAVSPEGVAFSKLGTVFLAPLIVSPVVSLLLASVVYPLAKLVREKCDVKAKSCLCIGAEVVGIVPQGMSPQQAALTMIGTAPVLRLGESPHCREIYCGKVFGIEARSVLDALHYLSAGLVGFARGLNDTPKIVAILLLGRAIDSQIAFVLVAISIAVGGLISSRKVAETMSNRITAMNAGQGFIANCVTALLVVFASRLGMPVSTTHVSCGALFGIGLITGQANKNMIVAILLAWVTTLPVAILASGFSALILRVL